MQGVVRALLAHGTQLRSQVPEITLTASTISLRNAASSTSGKGAAAGAQEARVNKPPRDPKELDFDRLYRRLRHHAGPNKQFPRSQRVLKLLAQKASTVEEAEKAIAILAMNRTLSARVDSFFPVESQVAAALMRVARQAGSAKLAVDILQRASQMSLKVSQQLCNQAAAVCRAAQDYGALEQVYSLQVLHCGRPNGKAVFQLMQHYSKAGMAADLAALAQEAEHYGIRLPPAGQKMAEAAQAQLKAGPSS